MSDVLNEIRNTNRYLIILIRRARRKGFKWRAIAWALDLDVKIALDRYAKIDPLEPRRPHRDPS